MIKKALRVFKDWVNKLTETINQKKVEKAYKKEYTTLTPDDNISNGDGYLKALKWAIRGKKAKNIALSGPYGSGKSSVIDTFLRKNWSVKRKSLKISMATFVEEVEGKNGDCMTQRIALKDGEIEKGILKQLFYKVNHKRIPLSRYRKILRISFVKVFGSLLLFCVLAFILCFVFSPEILEILKSKIVNAGLKLGIEQEIYSIGGSIILLMVILGFLSKLYQTCFSKYKVKEIKLPKDIAIKAENESTENVFNKNMDEVVYFFEATKYRYVFFEDLDRLNDSSIFIRLRELNVVLNNCDTIKEPIVFIYAVRDDIFTEKDRTKFFDFIIPIIPIINSTNSKEVFLKKISDSRALGADHNISNTFILDVAPFISDMRILQNIYNEFLVYKATLKTGQDLELVDEEMLALIIFKNLYPRDFSRLQMEQGIIKKAFDDKKDFTEKKEDEIQVRIDSSTKLLENISNEIMSTRRSVKYAFLCEITNGKGVARNFTPNGYSAVNSSTFMSDTYVLPDWSGASSFSVNCTTWGGTTLYLSHEDFAVKYNLFMQRYKAVSVIEDKKIEEEKILVENLRNEQRNLSSRTLSELIISYGETVLSDKVRENKLLLFLLRRGYINEKYVNYINYFKATSLTTADMNFILSVKNLYPKPYSYQLTRTDIVIDNLQPYEFEQEAILNFDVLEFLLSKDGYEEKLYLYLKLLSNDSEKSWEFINNFVDFTDYCDNFIQLLSKHWGGMWDRIHRDSTLTYTRKIYYLSKIFACADLDSIQAMNNNGLVAQFMAENEDVLQQLIPVDSDRLIKIISLLEVKFTKIDIIGVNSKVLDYIFDNSCYVINFDMIESIVEYKDTKLLPQLHTQNYTTLLKLGYLPLLEHIENNIDIYTDEIVLIGLNTEEDVDAILKLIRLNVNSKCRHTQIIGKQNFCLDEITVCCEDMWLEHQDYMDSVWNSIVSMGKMKPSWKNIYAYWQHLGFTDTLIEFLQISTSTLIKDDVSCIEDEAFIREFIQSNIDINSFRNLIVKLRWEGFDIPIDTLDESKVAILIESYYFKFDKGIYEEISSIYPKLAVEFIINNQRNYMDIHDVLDMNSTLLEDLILGERFSRANAQILLDLYGEDYMSIAIARKIGGIGLEISISVFDAAWSVLDIKEKEDLMMMCLDMLDANTFEKCFSEIGGHYSELADRSRRHTVNLDDNLNNSKLAQRLREIGYITSFERKERDDYSFDNDHSDSHWGIACRVRAVSPAYSS